jgi:anti-repressor protein
MNELIKITKHNGLTAVSARELYDFLEVRRDYSTWCKQMFEYGFEEEKDFSPILVKSQMGRPSIDYALTLDCAKEIAMIQRTPKGKQAREYFITCEKRLREASKPLSTLDMLELSIKQLRDQELKLTAIETDVRELKAATQVQSDYFTIVGYATLNNIRLGLQAAAKLGNKASRICREFGYQTEEMPDPRFGRVKLYPKSVLQRVFTDPL